MTKMRAYFTNIYRAVATTLVGLSVTGRYAFTRPVTLRYPEVRHKIPERYRGILHNKIEDCIGCLACARACPVDCIHIETGRRTKENVGEASDGTPIKLWVTKFDIDMALCMECGLCVPPCPTECLTMTPEYELAVNDKKGMYLEFALEGDRTKAETDALILEKEKAEKASQAAAAGGKEAGGTDGDPAGGGPAEPSS
jgi:NADH-quinone oxidoreductase subunit I